MPTQSEVLDLIAKLTEAQIQALRKLPCKIIMWGGKPFSGMPADIRSRSTLSALRKKGLVAVTYSGSTETWKPTEAGLATLRALSSQETDNAK